MASRFQGPHDASKLWTPQLHWPAAATRALHANILDSDSVSWPLHLSPCTYSRDSRSRQADLWLHPFILFVCFAASLSADHHCASQRSLITLATLYLATVARPTHRTPSSSRHTARDTLTRLTTCYPTCRSLRGLNNTKTHIHIHPAHPPSVSSHHHPSTN